MTGFVHGKDSLLGYFLRVAKRKGKCIARRTSRYIFLCALPPSKNTDKWTKIPIRENFFDLHPPPRSRVYPQRENMTKYDENREEIVKMRGLAMNFGVVPSVVLYTKISNTM